MRRTDLPPLEELVTGVLSDLEVRDQAREAAVKALGPSYSDLPAKYRLILNMDMQAAVDAVLGEAEMALIATLRRLAELEDGTDPTRP